ncbi:TetR/AcrR family transcriptional regulator [Microlunatus parietis]|uniref:AcrR family transcriptional regulator n=1 Tax=Microlunatus parietis TaxID=682979 RepID=A0A7Y9I8U3_9ACTN|nr:TetR/AcrR family transcriptional regulator [Microlunatus parietis]NYE72459.1 AcrR family transcriptional regulator [Microlunatus parietis]
MTEAGAQPTARRAQTQDKLMAAAVRVFAARGIIGASVEEISEEAGFTRGAFYSNFGDKDELVLALLKRQVEEQYAALEQIAELPLDPDRSLDDLISESLDVLQGAARPDPELILINQELMLYAARQRSVGRQYLTYQDECLARFRVLINDLLHKLGQEFTIDLDDAVTLCAAAHHQAHLLAALNNSRPDLRPLHLLIRAITRPLTP